MISGRGNGVGMGGMVDMGSTGGGDCRREENGK